MDTVIAVGAWLITSAMLFTLIARAWGRGSPAAKDRFALVSAAVDAIAVLMLLRITVPQPGALSWLWVAALGVAGFGVAGALLRWPSLQWDNPTREPRHPRRRMLYAATYLLAGSTLVALTL